MEGRGHQAKPNHTKKARRLSLDAMAKGSGDKHRQLFFFYNIFYLLKNKIAFKKHKHNKKKYKIASRQ
jgi:hypothetical protein